MENKKVDAVTLSQAFKYPSWMKLLRENSSPDRLVDVRMTYEDLKTIVDLANEKREKQQKSGVMIIRTEGGIDVRCNKCGNSYIMLNQLYSLEEAESELEEIRLDPKFSDCYCTYCGNDLRGKVHRY